VKNCLSENFKKVINNIFEQTIDKIDYLIKSSTSKNKDMSIKEKALNFKSNISKYIKSNFIKINKINDEMTNKTNSI